MSKIKNSGLDQYGAEAFEQQQFGTAGVKRVKYRPDKAIDLAHASGSIIASGHVTCWRLTQRLVSL